MRGGRADVLILDFEGADGQCPKAALSLAAAGDLRNPWPGENPLRAAFLARYGMTERDVAAPRLYHSRRVVACKDKADWIPGTLADGILSVPGGPIPSVTVADCMPIWILDLKRGFRAVLHSGWQGTGIALECLATMEKEWGSRPEDCSAIIGPHIRSCCYRVDPERAVQFMGEWGEASAVLQDGTWRLDLASVNESLLRNAGVARVRQYGGCTVCDTAYGSYRRQGKAFFTRMLAFFLPPEFAPS